MLESYNCALLLNFNNYNIGNDQGLDFITLKEVLKYDQINHKICLKTVKKK